MGNGSEGRRLGDAGPQRLADDSERHTPVQHFVGAAVLRGMGASHAASELTVALTILVCGLALSGCGGAETDDADDQGDESSCETFEGVCHEPRSTAHFDHECRSYKSAITSTRPGPVRAVVRWNEDAFSRFVSVYTWEKSPLYDQTDFETEVECVQTDLGEPPGCVVAEGGGSELVVFVTSGRILSSLDGTLDDFVVIGDCE